MQGSYKRILSILILCLVVIIPLIGCGSAAKNNAVSSGSYFIFDTLVTVKVYSEQVEDQHFEAIELILKDIDQATNRQLEGSEIDQVNRRAGIDAVKVSAETFLVVQKAMEYAAQSEGRFDPTIGPLVDLWGIGTEEAHRPDDAMLTQTVSLVNYKDVRLDETQQTIQLNRPDMSIDLGAIAKGYAADRVAEYLRSEGFESAIIDLGGNILAMGTKPSSELWTIGIQNPESKRGDNIGTLRVRNKTIVSSGVYERFFMHEGVHYHHILDPKTGYPVANNLLSITIVTNRSIDADALSTTVFSMGLEKGLAFVESLEDVDAFFITHEREIYISKGFAEELNITDASYTKH